MKPATVVALARFVGMDSDSLKLTNGFLYSGVQDGIMRRKLAYVFAIPILRALEFHVTH